MNSPEIFVDNFAGGGGASTGIEMAIGRSVDVAVNHDPEAIAMHRANHPATRHYCENIWRVDPLEACAGRPVALAWFSPDCKHHSKAKGGKPVDKRIRGLAWAAVRWARAVRPRVIMLENVEEFADWGPLTLESRPDPARKGETFRKFVSSLEGLGYRVEWRILRACDYGAPTVRRRLFLIARCDGRPIVWPEPTHATPESLEALCGLKRPWRTAADVIDFSLPCPSIFDTSDEIFAKYGVRAVRPLSDKTLRRIARGVMKFVTNNPRPFIVQVSSDDEARGQYAAQNLIQYHDEATGRGARGQAVCEPLLTVDASNRYGMVSAFISKYYGDANGRQTQGSEADEPLPTVTARDHNALAAVYIAQFNNHCDGSLADEPLNTETAGGGHFAETRAFLTRYNGKGDGAELDSPLPTATTKDRFGLVTVCGREYAITDIGLRMLTPRELFDAQGFPHDYVIDVDADGNAYPKSAQIARCGNAVCPPIPAALVRANLPEYCNHTKEVAS